MIRLILIPFFFIGVITPQSGVIELPPEKGVEFKLNGFSGFVFDEKTKKPIEDVTVEIYTGNKVLKHSMLTDQNGSFSKQNIGYLWKPRIKLKLENYHTKTVPILPNLLDSLGNIYVEYFVDHLPENERVAQVRKKHTITKRAETFYQREFILLS